MAKKIELPPEVREYFVETGRRGGRIGGMKTGKAKRRPTAHYAKLAAARKQAKKDREEREKP